MFGVGVKALTEKRICLTGQFRIASIQPFGIA